MSKTFEIKSDFKPAGDQPKAISKLVNAKLAAALKSKNIDASNNLMYLLAPGFGTNTTDVPPRASHCAFVMFVVLSK